MFPGLKPLAGVAMMIFASLNVAHAGLLVPAGVARVEISPREPVLLMGYASRANQPPPREVAQPIFARALALGDDAELAVLVTVDNCILPGAVTEDVRRRLGEKLRVRPEAVAVTVTHTHSAPCLSGAAPNLFASELAAADLAAIATYTQFLTDRIEQVALAACADRQPAELAWGKGRAGFAKNRRTAGGPVDHEMPLLRVTSPAGETRAVFVSYACHCTTLGGEFNAVHGDWAGVAAMAIERDHPGAIGLVAIGCGADANPEPRGSLALAVQHGEEIAREASRVIETTTLAALSGPPRCQLKTLQLPFQPHFSTAAWESRATQPGIVGFHASRWLGRLAHGEQMPASLPYPVQSWSFGDQLAIVFLAGEVVVDYGLRLKRELDSNRVWINAYANDVPCYIPSRRVLTEGGYEAETSLWYYDRPQRLAPETEDLIIAAVRELLPAFLVDPGPSEMPSPKTASEAIEAFRLRPGFQVELVASEPLVQSPVAIDFAADGRLWVCEMRDYPTGMDGQGKPGGCIKLLSDTDGDGSYDSAEVWADDLPFPTGLMAWRNGVLVCSAPDVWWLSRVDASSSSSNHLPIHRKKLLSGFATDNFQARVSGLRWGLDGWVHGSGGLFGGKITIHKTGQTIDCTNRDFRFRPDTGEFEPLAGVSQQGHVRDDFDQWFGNDNSTLLWHFPLPDRYRRRNPHVPGVAARVVRSRDSEPSRVFPVSRALARFNDPASENHITSGCGPEIYRDDLLGMELAGNVFACEPVHNLVRRAVIEADGVTFATRRAADEQHTEFLASTDNWFRPVEVRTGSDGALWVVDMYRFVIEHPRWIPPERLQKLDVRAGSERGRIWRVFPQKAKPRPIRNLATLLETDLTSVIDSPNGVERDLAHRLLLEAPSLNFAPVQKLAGLALHSPRAPTRGQALAVLHQRGRLDSMVLFAALRDSHPGVRRLAIRLCEPIPPATDAAPADPLLALTDDADASVRFQLALTLGEFQSEAAGFALARLALRDCSDEWSRAAILSSMMGSPRAFARSVLSFPRNHEGIAALRTEVLAALVSAERIDAVAEWIATAFPADAHETLLAALEEGLRLLGALAAKPHLATSLRNHGNSAAAESLDHLAHQLSGSALRLGTDSQLPEPTRLAALQLLAEQARTDAARRAELLSLLDTDLTESMRRACLAALQQQETPDIATALLDRWPLRAPAERLALLPILLAREVWTHSLLDAIERGDVAAAELSPAHRQQIRQHTDATLRARAEKLLPAPAASRAEAIKAFAGAAELKGDPLRGAALFGERCASCHLFKEKGHPFGPDLAAFGAKPIADLITAVVDPNAAIDPRYAGWIVDTRDGRNLSGIVRDETLTTLTLIQPGGGVESLRRSEIERLVAAAISIMPEGLETGLASQDLADLYAWIKATPPSQH